MDLNRILGEEIDDFNPDEDIKIDDEPQLCTKRRNKRKSARKSKVRTSRRDRDAKIANVSRNKRRMRPAKSSNRLRTNRSKSRVLKKDNHRKSARNNIKSSRNREIDNQNDLLVQNPPEKLDLNMDPYEIDQDIRSSLEFHNSNKNRKRNVTKFIKNVQKSMNLPVNSQKNNNRRRGRKMRRKKNKDVKNLDKNDNTNSLDRICMSDRNFNNNQIWKSNHENALISSRFFEEGHEEYERGLNEDIECYD